MEIFLQTLWNLKITFKKCFCGDEISQYFFILSMVQFKLAKIRINEKIN